MAGTTKSKDKYVAYVSTYTMKDDVGIRVYDVDVKNGKLTEKDYVKITNSSYLTMSHNRKYLYAITDLGVAGYEIQKDGTLKFINQASINGMRGCYLSTDYDDKFLFIAGYHDAKVTVLKLHKNGKVGEIADEIFNAGLGNVVERNFRPHVSCTKMTRDNKFLCVCDLGMDQVKIYEVNHKTGKLKFVDMIHSLQDSAPRYIKFHKNGKFAYIIHELGCTVDVYSYEVKNDLPEFNKIGSYTTFNDKYHTSSVIACAMKFSFDHKLLMCSNAGENSVAIYAIDEKTGLLDKRFVLPISGDYPKDVAFFPDSKHIVSLNHESSTMSFFDLDLKNNIIVMHGAFMKVAHGNCIIMKRLDSDSE